MLWIESWSLSPADRVVVDWRISEYELVDDNEASHVDKSVVLFSEFCMRYDLRRSSALGRHFHTIDLFGPSFSRSAILSPTNSASSVSLLLLRLQHLGHWKRPKWRHWDNWQSLWQKFSGLDSVKKYRQTTSPLTYTTRKQQNRRAKEIYKTSSAVHVFGGMAFWHR